MSGQKVDECIRGDEFMKQMENHACEVRKRRAKVAPEKIASKKDKIVMKKRVTGKLRPVGKKGDGST